MRLTCLILFLLFLRASIFAKNSENDKKIEELHRKAYELLDSDLDSALSLAKAAENEAIHLGLSYEEGNSIFIQAYVFRQKNELGKAFILYLKALEVLKPQKQEKAQIAYLKILLNTGEILDRHHAYAQSVKYYNEGIDIADKNGYSDRLLNLYYNKAYALWNDQKFEEALDVTNRTLDLAVMKQNDDIILSTLNLQGLIYKDLKQYEVARAKYQKIISFGQDNSYIGKAWHNIGVTYLAENNLGEAKDAFINASNKNKDGSRMQYITWMDLGETYHLSDNNKAAYETCVKALNLYDQMLLSPDHYALFSLLSKVTHELGAHSESHLYSRRFEEESKKFLKAQEDLLKVKDQYKMEILTAGFFQEIEASETEKQYQLWLILCAAFFTSLILFEKGRQYYIRRSIKIAIQRIEAETE